MTRLLFGIAALLFGVLHTGFTDNNIYGPGGINLGPNGNPIESYRQMSEQKAKQAKLDELRSGTLVLHQQFNGHYFVQGFINNEPLEFVLDTGASYVTLPANAAKNAGVSCEHDAFIDTANGRVKACAATIARLTFGNFTHNDVRCIIAGNLSKALLGNNVLQHYQIGQSNGELRLSR